MKINELQEFLRCGPTFIDDAIRWVESRFSAHHRDGHVVRLEIANWLWLSIATFDWEEKGEDFFDKRLECRNCLSASLHQSYTTNSPSEEHLLGRSGKDEEYHEECDLVVLEVKNN